MTLYDIKQKYLDETDAAELRYRNVDRDNTSIAYQADLLEKWLSVRESYREFCKDNGLNCER